MASEDETESVPQKFPMSRTRDRDMEHDVRVGMPIPNSNPPARTSLGVAALDKLSEDGWEVVSIEWRDGEMRSALVRRPRPIPLPAPLN